MTSYARRPRLAALLVVFLLMLSPAAVWLALAATPLPEALVTSVVLMAAAPPIVGATSFALLLGLDAALAVVAVLAATLLTPITLPPMALALLGVELEVGVGAFMMRLGALVAGAFVGAALLRRLAGRARLRGWAREIDGVVVVVLLIFAVAIMAGVTEALFERPGTVALWLAAAFLANPALQVLGGLAFCWLGRRGRLTVGLLAGNRNMGLLLAALPEGADFDVALYFAIAQLPMYMLPAMLLPLYRRLLAGAGGT